MNTPSLAQRPAEMSKVPPVRFRIGEGKLPPAGGSEEEHSSSCHCHVAGEDAREGPEFIVLKQVRELVALSKVAAPWGCSKRATLYSAT